MSLRYVKKLYKQFQSVLGSGYLIYGDFPLISNDGPDPILKYFSVTDLKALPQFPSAKVWEKYEKVPKIKRIVMEKSVAEKEGVKKHIRRRSSGGVILGRSSRACRFSVE